MLQPQQQQPHAHAAILQPTRVHNHPAAIAPTQHTDLDSALSEYQRSRARSTRLEAAASVGNGDPSPYDFATNPRAVEHLLLSLRALIAVIKTNPNVEIQCVGHFDWLFGFVAHGLVRTAAGTASDADSRAVKALTLDVVSLVSRNAECVKEIAAAEILGHFLVAIRDAHLDDRQQSVLHTLSGLLNAQRLIKEAQRRGAVCYLLDLFCASRTPQTREQCAELLAKMTADKLTGPKVRQRD